MPTPPLKPEGPGEADIFEDTRHLFHALRGRLSVILSATDLLRTDPHGLSPAQAAQVTRLEATATDLQDSIANLGNRLLDTLAFTPASRLIWHVRCLSGTVVDLDILRAHMAEMATAYPLNTFSEVIIVGEAVALPHLRAAFTRLGLLVRVATAPSDVGFLLDEAPCGLIAMQPPMDSEGHWWRLLRTLLQGSRHQPLMLHLAAKDP
ncbi:MAG: hypothetical protein H0X24_12715 [Ktedonobacterales bacterium]|nr:hypothetical protein [Ktedonobacterales bacterium]